MNALETLIVLPDPGERRFGTTVLGTDRIRTIREEHVALRDVAADLCGVPPDMLTGDDLARYRERRTAALASTDDRLTVDAAWFAFQRALGDGKARREAALNLAAAALAAAAKAHDPTR